MFWKVVPNKNRRTNRYTAVAQGLRCACLPGVRTDSAGNPRLLLAEFKKLKL